MRRNAAMLQQVVGAADELADAAAADEHEQDDVALKKARARSERHMAEIARLGPRKSTRRSTQVATQKIAKAFASGSDSSDEGAPPHCCHLLYAAQHQVCAGWFNAGPPQLKAWSLTDRLAPVRMHAHRDCRRYRRADTGILVSTEAPHCRGLSRGILGRIRQQRRRRGLGWRGGRRRRLPGELRGRAQLGAGAIGCRGDERRASGAPLKAPEASPRLACAAGGCGTSGAAQ